MAVPLADQVRCVERELSFRRRVYARRVLNKQMTEEQSNREIAAMEAVLDTVKLAAAGERLL